MLFFAYFDPSLIGYAEGQGEAVQHLLIRMLRDFCGNCCLAEIDEWKVATSIKNEVGQIKDQNYRDRIKRLMTMLKKRNRFVGCIRDEFDPEKSDVRLAVEQADEAGLGLIATQTDCSGWRQPERAEVSGVLAYGDTEFFNRREDSANHGCTFAEGGAAAEEMLAATFGPVVRHCRSIEITDRLWGPKFGDSFQFTTKRLLSLIAKENKNPGTCRICIHTEVTPRLSRIKEQLHRLRCGCVVEVRCHAADQLPHDRFLWTDQIALTIGRGMDFLSPRDEFTRDTTISLKKPEDIEKLMPKAEPVEITEVLGEN